MDRIKESFDSLPVAACFFDANGVVRLINHRMLTIGNQLRRGGIQTLTELQSALESPPDAIRCLNPELQIFRFPDGTALRFARESITTRAGIPYTQVTAGDVTERIHRQNQLKEENEKLTQANERLRLLFRQMPDIIRQEETLAMKLRVHDNIGHSILAARRTLLRQPGLEEIRACAALWEQSITVLYRSNQMTVPPEPMEAAIRRAGEMGVRVLPEGPQPQTREQRYLTALAVRECAANCARHAGGTELYVRFCPGPGGMEVIFRNNGTPPRGKITEGGGLSMLRLRVEAAGGRMEIRSSPGFRLRLTLPEKEESDHACGDC